VDDGTPGFDLMPIGDALSHRLIQSVASLAGRSGDRSLVVLIFHRVLEAPDPLLPFEPDAGRFAAEMEVLRRCFRVLPLREAVHRMLAGSLPARSACITFDDGYANNCEVALPILMDKSLPATVFVAPGFLNGGRMFNDTVIEAVRRARSDLDLRAEALGSYRLDDDAARRKCIDDLLSRLKYLELHERLRLIDRLAQAVGGSLPDDLMMTDRQVRRLHASGIEIGAHTMDHPILASMDDESARRQIASSKQALENLIGSPVKSFAYPNGKPGRDYDARHVAMARDAGFDLALSTAWGAATRHSDVFQIPRVAAWDRAAWKYGLRLALAFRQREFATA
jgi:peptidoglycan/xylan/chitin deacetylase (PgdA/CDA1 family)